MSDINKKQYIHIESTENNLTTDYDMAGSLLRVKTTHTGVSNKTEAEYTYFPTGQSKRLALGSSPVAQGVDYRYNTRDWLIRINHYTLHPANDPGGDSNDRFGMNIGYDQHEGISWWLSSTPQYNGNISWVMYNLHGVNFNIYGYPTSRVGYVYKYDKANRLLRADFAAYLYGDWYADNAYNLRDIYYHKNGNITGLKRYGHTGMLKDNLTYTYYSNTNRLRRVADQVSTTDYDDVHPQPANNYVYDANGNMIQDTIHKVGFIIYDIFNQPVTVYTTDGNEHLYYYDHQGSRVRKRIGGSSDYYINGIDGRTEVVTNFNGAWATYNLYGLDVIGQIRRSGSTWNRFYFLKDHLGSVRVTVNTSGNVVSYDDYYPFGALMYGRSQDSSSVDGRYKYTGKERDAETKYDYFGARYYDARIGRFLSVDPLSDDERLIGWSPYHYGYNSPIVYIDPNGMRPQFEEDDEERERKSRIVQKKETPADLEFIRSRDANNKYTSSELSDKRDTKISKISLSSAAITIGIKRGVDLLEGVHKGYMELQKLSSLNNLGVSFETELTKVRNYQMIGRLATSTITIATSTYETIAGLSRGEYGQAAISGGIGTASLLSGPLGLYYLAIEQTIGWENVPAMWVQYELNRHERMIKGLPTGGFRR